MYDTKIFMDWMSIKNDCKYSILEKDNYNEVIFINNNSKLCKRMFNFMEEGNRCLCCNILSYRYPTGQITDNLTVESDEFNILRDNIEFTEYDKIKYEDTIKHLIPHQSICNMFKDKSNFCLKNASNQYHKYVIDCIVDSEMFKINSNVLNTVVNQYICSDKMVIVENSSKHLQTNTPLSKIQCRDIMFSIINWCYNVNFSLFYSHGDVKLSSIRFSNQDSSIYFDDKEYKAKTKVYIKNSQNTSITCVNYKDESVRICNPQDKEYDRVIMSNKFVESSVCDDDCSNLITIEGYNAVLCYLFDENLLDMYKHSGKMIFNSLDFYQFITVLLTNKDMRDYVYHDSFMRHLFDELFLYGDFQIVINRAEDNLDDLLKDIYLRCDGLAYAMKRIKDEMSSLLNVKTKSVNKRNVSSPKRR